MPNKTKAELQADNQKLTRQVAALEKAAAKPAPKKPASGKLLSAQLLYAEQREAATAEILKVIASSPSDVQPVFDAIARSAKRLLDGRAGVVTRVMGETLQLAAFTSINQEADASLTVLFPYSFSSSTSLHAAAVRN